MKKEEEYLERKKQLVKYNLEINEKLELNKKKALLERRKADDVMNSPTKIPGRRAASLDRGSRFNESKDYNLSNEDDQYFNDKIGGGGQNW